MKRVIGIDPGLRITGYGIIDVRDVGVSTLADPNLVEAGVIRLDAKRSMDHRLGQLFQELSQLFDENKPGVLAVEKLYAHYKHPRTAILMAHARGVILLAAQIHGVPVVDLGATMVKKSVTGNGHASKEQVQRSIQHHFRLRDLPEPPDIADALAIAMTCARRDAVENAVA